MNKHKKKYERIIDGLIRQSFPELEEKRIILLGFILYKEYAAQVWDLGFVKIVFLNLEKIKNYSETQFVGLFAHELCHLYRFSKKNLWQKIRFVFSVSFSKDLRRHDEVETDKCAARKGYARQLYVNRKASWSKRPANDPLKKIYLSPKQIKAYAMKIGKW